MKNVNEKIAWTIIQKAGLKAIKLIYDEFLQNLRNTNIVLQEPGGSSFRIVVPEQTSGLLYRY